MIQTQYRTILETITPGFDRTVGPAPPLPFRNATFPEQ